jgi:hypothetical protein
MTVGLLTAESKVLLKEKIQIDLHLKGLGVAFYP